jgi:hypothetical protein
MSEQLNLLEQLAAGLEDDPGFMAWALVRYRETESLPDTGALTARLNLAPPLLARLSLCKRPRSDDPDFALRVRQLADFVSLDAADLANLLHQVEFLEKLKPPRPTDERIVQFFVAAPHVPLLAAARDRVGSDDSDAASSTTPDAPR